MGLIKPIDVTIVKDREYDVLTALAVNGEYIEEIGEACENPAGYTQGSIFLARNDVVMHLYKATANITAGQAMTIGTNCELSSLDAMFKKSGQDLDSVKQALSDEAEKENLFGVHNVLRNPLSNIKARNTTGTWSDNVYSINGITFTVNADESITVDTNGSTATQSTWFEIINGQNDLLNVEVGKSYIYSTDGTTDDSFGDNNCYSYLQYINNSSAKIQSNSAVSARSFTVSALSTSLKEYIYVESGATISNRTFCQMVRLATDTDKKYQKGAMTNQQLTENLAGNYLLSKIQELSVSSDGSKSYKQLFNDLYTAASTWATNNLGTDDYAEAVELFVGEVAWTRNTRRIVLTKSSVPTLEFIDNSFNATNILAFHAIVRASTSTFESVVTNISSGAITYTDRTNDVMPSGRTYKLTLEVYKKIQ